jgi:uncharacterized protein YjbI with pentapeptide repeats
MSLLSLLKDAFEVYFERYKARAELKIISEKAFRERIDKIIKGLGSDKLEVRLSSIYEFERMAKESIDVYSTLINILPVFIRRRAPLSDKDEEALSRHEDDDNLSPPEEDVQLALRTLCRLFRSRRHEVDNGRLELCEMNLRGAKLEDEDLSFVGGHCVNFSNAHFSGADLSYASFSSSGFYNANFGHARLESSFFISCNFKSAFFSGADLRNAKLVGCHLENSSFNEACLEGADFTLAKLNDSHLQASNLKNVVLARAEMQNANLRDTVLDDAILYQANLMNARGMTTDQLCKALTLYGAKIHKEFKLALKRKCPHLFDRKSVTKTNAALRLTTGPLVFDIYGKRK